MKMLIDPDTLREQIACDPDMPCEVGRATRSRSKRPRKYGPGEPFTSLDELLDFAVSAWRDGGDAFVWREFGNGKGRPEHAFWTINGSAFHLARRLIPHGAIKRAVVTAEYKSWLDRETAEAPR